MLRLTSAMALLMCAVTTVSGQFVFAHMGGDVSTFSTPDELTSRGSVELRDRFLCLTPAAAFHVGAVWYSEKQDVQAGFGTIFQFRVSDTGNDFEDGIPSFAGGDGFAFVIQNSSPKAAGANGGGLGYHGIRNSLAVEFDTWDNATSDQGYVGDPNPNHVSIHTCGADANSELEVHSLGATEQIPNISDGNIHTVIIEYGAGVLSVFVDKLDMPVLLAEVDLDNLIEFDDGRAWVGFTAATGLAYENHDLLNWPIPARGGTERQ